MYCSNLFGKMMRDVNFNNIIVEILIKSKSGERDMMWQKGRREKKKRIVGKKICNCGNSIVETWEKWWKEIHQHGCRNLGNFGAHKERELVEGGEKIW